jgi:hypothetical protein
MNTREDKNLNKDMIKFYIAIICVVLSGCASQELSLDELQSYIADEDNGLQLSAEANGTKISVTYRPTDLWVHQEISDAAVDKTVVDALRKKYSAYYYFIVSFSRNNKEAVHQMNSMEDYGDLVQTMSFRMSQYAVLTTAKQDTIPVSDFMMNRTYGLSSSTDVLFAFNKEKVKANDWVQINLKEFGLGLGNQRFRFITKNLEETPFLHFQLID